MYEADDMTAPKRYSRREFLGRSAVLGAAALAVGRVGFAQAARPEAIRLAEKIVAFRGPDANSVAVDTAEGIVLIDGGSTSWSDALLARVRDELGSKPFRALLNTHWHPEQTGSNVTLGEQGVPIIAHENTKLWLGTEVWVRWADKKYPPLPAAGLPTTTFYESGSMKLAERTVEYRYLLNAHTDGDVCVYFPEENVLVTGGHVSNEGWPIIDWWTGGWIGGMLDGYQALLEIANEETRIVPAIGPMMTLSDLRSQYDMYLAIFDRLRTMLRKSYGTDEVLAARPTAEYDAQWGDPELFVTLAFHSLWGHLRDAYETRLGRIP